MASAAVDTSASAGDEGPLAAPPSASGALDAKQPPADTASKAAQDVTLSIADPTTESAKTAKVPVGKSVSVRLPERPGTTWTVKAVDRTLGRPTEQTIPGFFSPTLPAHEFKWSLTGPLHKAGHVHKVRVFNEELNEKPGKPSTTFDLTIEVI